MKTINYCIIFSIISLLNCLEESNNNNEMLSCSLPFVTHPKLRIDFIDTTLLLSTSKAIEGMTIRVANEKCTLTVISLKNDTGITKMTCIVQNIAPFKNGGFHGFWRPPDSLLSNKLKIFACISDTTGQNSCDSIKINF